MIASENSPLRNSPRVLSAKRFDRVEKMKRTVKLSLGFCIAMLTIALAAPHLSSPKLVLRFLPKDVYEAGKDHPAPSLPKRLLGHLLLVITAAYAVWDTGISLMGSGGKRFLLKRLIRGCWHS